MMSLVEHYMNSEVASARILARVANYPLFVHQYYPAEMRAQTTAAAVRAFGLRRALQAFRSPAFEALMDQEINAMYFMKDQFQIATKATNEMLRKVEAERAAEGGS